MGNLNIGHLKTADSAKISTIPVKEGNVIYSEGPGMQFVDFNSKRHAYGSVLSGVYNGSTYVDFNDATIAEIFTALLNNNTQSGQIVTMFGFGGVYITGDNNTGYIKLFNNTGMEDAYYLRLSAYLSDNYKIDLVIYQNNNLYYMSGSDINNLSVVDLDGNDASSNFDIAYDNELTAEISSTSPFKILSASLIEENTAYPIDIYELCSVEFK